MYKASLHRPQDEDESLEAQPMGNFLMEKVSFTQENWVGALARTYPCGFFNEKTRKSSHSDIVLMLF